MADLAFAANCFGLGSRGDAREAGGDPRNRVSAHKQTTLGLADLRLVA